MDAITLNRINLLHPKIRQEVLQAYQHINSRLFGSNIRLRFTHTFRTFQEQDALYAQGRTLLSDSNGRRVGKVTNAKAGQSIHNFGLAFDIVVLVDKDGNGSFESASWDTKADHDKDLTADWAEAVAHFNKLGYTWGGDWRSFPDYPHFEKTFGHTWRSLLQKHNSGDTFTESIDGKIYKWVNL